MRQKVYRWLLKKRIIIAVLVELYMNYVYCMTIFEIDDTKLAGKQRVCNKYENLYNWQCVVLLRQQADTQIQQKTIFKIKLYYALDLSSAQCILHPFQLKVNYQN